MHCDFFDSAFIEFGKIPKMPLIYQLMSLPEYIEKGISVDLGDVQKSNRICIFGLGESSIAGDIVSAYADDFSDIPVLSVTSGIVPGWVDDDTDVIIVSYFGDNEINNEIYDKVSERGCRIYCLTYDGRLKNRCELDGNVHIQIPSGLSPRSSMGFELGVLSSLLQKMDICDAKDRLVSLLPRIKGYRDSLNDDLRINDLKFKLLDNTVAIYGSPDFRASYKRWKMSLNEDMGFPAFCGELPEFNHNEIVGWANHNQNDEDLRIVILRGRYKNEVLTEVIDKMIEVLEESGRHVIDIKILGDDPMEKNLRAILLGEYVSQKMKHENRSPMTWREHE